MYNSIFSRSLVILLLLASNQVSAKDEAGLEKLHHVAASGNPETIHALIKAGENLEAKSHKGDTPLHLAALHGTPGNIDALIEAGANLEAENQEGLTPLHVACISRKTENINVLAKAGANLEAKTSEDYTPLHMAASHGKRENMDALIKAGANLEAKNHAGDTPLHLAAFHAKPENMDALIEAGANLEAKNHEGDTPLHLAALHGTPGNIDALIEAGANLEAKNQKGLTPLHKACISRKAENINVLVKVGANLEAKAGLYTPLLLAVLDRNLEAIRILLRAKGSDIESMPYYFGGIFEFGQQYLYRIFRDYVFYYAPHLLPIKFSHMIQDVETRNLASVFYTKLIQVFIGEQYLAELFTGHTPVISHLNEYFYVPNLFNSITNYLGPFIWRDIESQAKFENGRADLAWYAKFVNGILYFYNLAMEARLFLEERTKLKEEAQQNRFNERNSIEDNHRAGYEAILLEESKSSPEIKYPLERLHFQALAEVEKIRFSLVEKSGLLQALSRSEDDLKQSIPFKKRMLEKDAALMVTEVEREEYLARLELQTSMINAPVMGRYEQEQSKRRREIQRHEQDKANARKESESNEERVREDLEKDESRDLKRIIKEVEVFEQRALSREYERDLTNQRSFHRTGGAAAAASNADAVLLPHDVTIDFDHILERHTGSAQRDLPGVFHQRFHSEEAFIRLLNRHIDVLRAHAGSAVNIDCGENIGMVAWKDGSGGGVSRTRMMRVVVEKVPSGIRIKTAYPYRI